ncbi:MAG: prepilin-type N-terminal cleavage/methylation domain-containing protein [Gammaproteobacteria bacterium]|nr:prepilin-type N-terminal cleavage/methylation domain-containing protein [Gammaproteobacteria bacterium]
MSRLSLSIRKNDSGFTLIELLVVMTIIATLLSIALPRYFNSLDNAKEVTLKQDLAQMRDAIDKFYSDTGKYPQTLDELVEKKYLRAIPPDPITETIDSWLTAAPEDSTMDEVFNVSSGAEGTARDGTLYSEW